jgi:plasmid stabilization system protein ParE
MASLPIRYRRAAIDELAEAIGWYGERDERVANEFRDVVRSKLREVANNPKRWPLESDGTRQVL